MLVRTARLRSSCLRSRRFVSTETLSSSNSQSEIPPLPSSQKSRPSAKFSPAPRPAAAQTPARPLPSSNSTTAPPASPSEKRPTKTQQQSPLALPYLFPKNFGQNQVLSVPDSTRALLEEITRSFDAPIRYAFAYGSGVFKQDGYAGNGPKPLLDFVFAVNHPSHWHSINLNQYPSHYPLHARLAGSEMIARVQRISPGIWYNTYVPMSGVTIKYGVTTVDNLCSDLLSWNTLYLSGRMHKPIRIIKDDARVRLTQQVNLVSALRVALLTLPEQFDERELFERMANFSYAGDPRMSVGGENKGKVGNIVNAQAPQFRELYQRLANGLPGIHWAAGSASVQQDVSPRARGALLRKLPSNLVNRLENKYTTQFKALGVDVPLVETDASAFWSKVGADDKLPGNIDAELRGIVRGPATVQSLKGIVTTGLTKSVRYGAAKVGKWWRS